MPTHIQTPLRGFLGLPLFFLPLLVASSFLASSCGYSLQRSEQPPSFQREGIRKIYVAPVENNTYKAGVENLVYNQVVRILSASRRIALVPNENDADAVLRGTVHGATYGASANTTASELFPKDRVPGYPRGSSDIRVASEYSGSLSCGFSLRRRVAAPGKRMDLWSDGFTKSKPFPANNQLGVFGTTSALINESEFDRILRDLAETIASDLHESMLAGF